MRVALNIGAACVISHVVEAGGCVLRERESFMFPLW